MVDFPALAWFYEYHGKKLAYHSGGGSWKRVLVEGDMNLDLFPEALEFSSDASESWVMLPNTAFDAAYLRTVSGRWHGAPVAVESIVKRAGR